MTTTLLKAGLVSAGIAASMVLVDLQPASATGFYGDYALSNWQLINLDTPLHGGPQVTDGFVTPSSGSANSITLTGGNAYGGTPPLTGGYAGVTYIQTTLKAAGTVSFNYSYGTYDADGFDPFIVNINNVWDPNFVVDTNGSTGTYTSPFLAAGSTFAFGIITLPDNTGYGGNAFGAGYVTISNFSAPSSAAAVPTPALLPGLIGMGVAALRKKQQDNQELSA